MLVYDAFISYSHAKDKPIAAALQSAMQRLGKPWYSPRAIRIFRDDTSLSATPHLWPAIQRALDRSRFLILLCSPEAAASPWVAKEVDYWLAHKSPENLLIGVTDGRLTWNSGIRDFDLSPTHPLPSALACRFTDEPKWVDLNAYRRGANPRDATFIDRAADFAATIRGIPKEDLLSQEIREHQRALATAMSAAAVLLVVAVVAAWQWRQAETQRNRAEGVLAAAMQNATRLVNNAVNLRNTVGIPVDLVRDILTQAEDLQDQLTRYSESKATPARWQSITLRETSRNLLNAGETARALETAQRSREIVEQLLAGDRNNVDLQGDLALSYNTIGEALLRAGRGDEAIEAFRASLVIRNRLSQSRPDSESLRALAVSHERVGDRLFDLQRRDEALAEYQKSFDVREKLVAAEPDNLDFRSDLAIGYDRIGRMLDNNDPECLAVYNKSLAIRKSLVLARPRVLPWQRDLATTYDKVGDILRTSHRDQEALASYREAFNIRARLAESDSSNAQLQIIFVISLVRLSDMNDNPLQYLTRARDILTRLAGENKLGAGQTGWLDNIERRLVSLSD